MYLTALRSFDLIKIKYLPSSAKALFQNGVVTSQRTVLDDEGRAWLTAALIEFRECQRIDLYWVSPKLAAATIGRMPGFNEDNYATTDEAADSTS
jgi:hypothetical protein